MKVIFELPFIYHFEDYHEGSYYAKFLSDTLGVDIHCEELDKDKYPTHADYPSNVTFPGDTSNVYSRLYLLMRSYPFS